MKFDRTPPDIKKDVIIECGTCPRNNAECPLRRDWKEYNETLRGQIPSRLNAQIMECDHPGCDTDVVHGGGYTEKGPIFFVSVTVTIYQN